MSNHEAEYVEAREAVHTASNLTEKAAAEKLAARIARKGGFYGTGRELALDAAARSNVKEA